MLIRRLAPVALVLGSLLAGNLCLAANGVEPDESAECSGRMEPAPSPIVTRSVKFTRLGRVRWHLTQIRQTFRRDQREHGTGMAATLVAARWVGRTVAKLAPRALLPPGEAPPSQPISIEEATAHYRRLRGVLDAVVADAREIGIETAVSEGPIKMNASLMIEENGAVVLDLREGEPVSFITPAGDLVIFEKLGPEALANLRAKLTQTLGLIEAIPLTSDPFPSPKMYVATRLPDGTPTPEPNFVNWDDRGIPYSAYTNAWNIARGNWREAYRPPAPSPEIVYDWNGFKDNE